MKTWKLVSGILTIVFSVFVMFQSSAAGLYNSLSQNGETSGSAGFFVALLMLTGGIVSIATRKGGKGGNIALLILFGFSTLIGGSSAGSYTDLYIWSGWCGINAVLALICMLRKQKIEDIL